MDQASAEGEEDKDALIGETALGGDDGRHEVTCRSTAYIPKMGERRAKPPRASGELRGKAADTREEMMEKLGWICLSLVSLSAPLGAFPMASSSEASLWVPAIDEDAGLGLEALGSWDRRSLPQSLTGLLEAETDRQAGIIPNKAVVSFSDRRPKSFKARENIKEALLGNLPRKVLLNRLLPANRKPFKKRGNLSECFWKYCV
nr:urotensin-2-like isoform X2 [Pogona vitticeps]